MVICKVQQIKQVLQDQRRDQGRVVARVLEGVKEILEERAAASGVPTCESVAAAVLQQLEAAGVVRLEAQVQATTTTTPPEAQGRSWRGLIHEFRAGTALPSGPPYQAWIRWCCRDSISDTPPLWHLQPSQLGPKENKRKRLSDLRFLMQKLEARATELGIQTENVSMLDAASIFDQCKCAIAVDEETPRERRRRSAQLDWLTVANLLRKKIRS
jgi:hypothetical protein